ncbi:cupin domain-containing protein [Negadavirga shengliensis]|uniref:Cupin domain-containing protein n=1 Tax=Negadavirga shengliensis TaxID=1389218 RepID=A0ABV9T7A7_9BACT
MNATTAQIPARNNRWYVFSLLLFPLGLLYIWRLPTSIFIKIAYTVLAPPLFLYLTLLILSVALPPLDLTVGNRQDRTLYNPSGNYAVTFLKTGKETGGAYEEILVELEAGGGNGWHYHTTFDEQFTVIEGQVEIGLNGEAIYLEKGQTVTARKSEEHYFHNPTSGKSNLLVKTIPARGLEKTIRIGYGLENDGLMQEDMTENPWHMALLLGYSETYFGGIPAVVQAPVVNGLARLAQWLGHDKDLKKYFM